VEELKRKTLTKEAQEVLGERLKIRRKGLKM
jgi:hypothetical protein